MSSHKSSATTISHDDIFVPSITSRELEGGLDALLTSFVEDGRTTTNGAVLFQSLPSSKIRSSAQQPLSSKASFQPISYSAERHNNIDGYYVLKACASEASVKWVADAERADRPLPKAELQGLLVSGNTFGAQCQGIKSTAQGLRKALDIGSFPVSAPDGRFRSACIEAGASHLYTSFIDVSTTASPVTVRLAPVNLTSIIFHHRGASQHWIIVPPTAKLKLEDRIRQEFATELAQTDCSQFIQHLGLWLQPSILDQWKVPYFEVEQQVHQLLFVFPGAYFWGCSAGFGIVESKCYAGSFWDPTGYRFCHRASNLCSEPFYRVEVPETRSQLQQTPLPRSPTPSAHDTSTSASASTRAKTLKRRAPDFELLSKRPKGYSADEPATIVAAVPTTTALLANSNLNLVDFTISDDEDITTIDQTSHETLVQRLRREKADLSRDLEHMRQERDDLATRKMMYKARLLEREALIKRLQQQIHDSKVSIWQEMKVLVDIRLEGLAAENGNGNQNQNQDS